MKINASDHLNYLLNNIDKLAVNNQPLWHPLGFVSCSIYHYEQLTLRVHYWPPNERRVKNPHWPVHTHSYALSSFVLHGNIEDTQYETNVGDACSIYQVSYLNEDSEVSNTGRKIAISQSITEKRSVGDQYRVECGVFHQSSVKFTESAVTFVALSEPSNNPPLVLGSDGDQKYLYERIPFSKEEFWKAVKESTAKFIDSSSAIND